LGVSGQKPPILCSLEFISLTFQWFVVSLEKESYDKNKLQNRMKCHQYEINHPFLVSMKNFIEKRLLHAKKNMKQPKSTNKSRKLKTIYKKEENL